jgi:hypothetical protein
VLLYIANDPEAPRPMSTGAHFAAHWHAQTQPRSRKSRHGLWVGSGQVRRGLRLLQRHTAFEDFITNRTHYFVEPLYYHNAVIFERYGFAYQMGKRRMEAIHTGFQEGGELYQGLGNSNPFRPARAANSIRLRSWAIHDGMLGEPYTNVTMYKRVRKSADISTTPGCEW